MGGAANLELLYQLAEHLRAERIVETGIAYGWSSLALLLSLAKRERSLLISTDMPYVWRDNDRYVGCVVPRRLRSNWKRIFRPDREALPLALRIAGPIDLGHYDSDKSVDGRAWAYPTLWKALRPGGIFVSDDVGDNLEFKRFSESIHQKPLIVASSQPGQSRFAGVLQKPR
jgi:predicted O-methyltransferase YrrM